MQIELGNGQSIDTNKLTDMDAEIHEAMNTFYKVLRKYDKTAFLRIILDNKRYIGFSSVPKTQEKLNEDYDCLMTEIHEFVQKSSGGRIALMQQRDEPEFPIPPEE